MDRIAISESNNEILDMWYATAREMRDPEDLVKFIKQLSTDYQHDYGTICHALSAAAVAAAHVMDRQPGGGITGFQAGAVFWNFYRHWLGEKGPARIINYGDMLYPQYQDKFTKLTISKDTWTWLQAEAKKRLGDEVVDGKGLPIFEHWDSILRGVVPFGYEVEKE